MLKNNIEMMAKQIANELKKYVFNCAKEYTKSYIYKLVSEHVVSELPIGISGNHSHTSFISWYSKTPNPDGLIKLAITDSNTSQDYKCRAGVFLHKINDNNHMIILNMPYIEDTGNSNGNGMNASEARNSMLNPFNYNFNKKKIYTTIFLIGNDKKEIIKRLNKSINNPKAEATENVNDVDRNIRVVTDNSSQYQKGRKWSSVALDNKDDLIKHIEDWKMKEAMYDKYNIPHKLCILSYGEPGTGKTTIAKAVATQLGYDLVLVNINTMGTSGGVNLTEDRKVYLFEDIDCLVGNRETGNMSEKEREKLGDLLQIIDGVKTTNHSVYIATTNYINSLDKALKRDGRFDIKIELPNLDYEKAKQLCLNYDLPTSVLDELQMPINPAKLQNFLVQLKLKQLKSIKVAKKQPTDDSTES